MEGNFPDMASRNMIHFQRPAGQSREGLTCETASFRGLL